VSKPKPPWDLTEAQRRQLREARAEAKRNPQIWRCAECGWEWPLSGTPVTGSECDNCGGELTTED